MGKILVIGSSGTVGSALAARLKAQGETVVRATSRQATAPDQVQVDLRTGAGLDAALEGVDRAFILAPPGHVDQDVLLQPVLDAVAARRLRKVVLMTAMGANADDNAPLRKAELRLERSGLDYTILRPNWFMQNFNTFWLGGIRAHAEIQLPVGRARGSFIDARDIAETAAELLINGGHAGQAYDLTGPQALDHDEVAALLSSAAGRSIGFRDVTPEVMRGHLLQGGLPADYAEFLLLILGYFKAGYSERTTDAVKQITGHAPRTFLEYARDYREAFSAAA